MYYCIWFGTFWNYTSINFFPSNFEVIVSYYYLHLPGSCQEPCSGPLGSCQWPALPTWLRRDWWAGNPSLPKWRMNASGIAPFSLYSTLLWPGPKGTIGCHFVCSPYLPFPVRGIHGQHTTRKPLEFIMQLSNTHSLEMKCALALKWWIIAILWTL